MATKITYTLPKDAASLNTMIATAIKSANTMKTKVQLAAVAILHHTFLHGDYTSANTLVDGLGHGVKRDSLVAFFVELGGLTISEEAKEFDGWQGKDYIKNNFEAAKATMWYDFKKASSPFKGYDFEAEIQKVMERHIKMQDKMDDLEDADKAAVSFDIKESTIKQLLSLCNFEAIIEGDSDDSQEAA